MLFLIELGLWQTCLQEVSLNWGKKTPNCKEAFLLGSFTLAWPSALSCPGAGCTHDQCIPWDTSSRLPCCLARDRFNILAASWLLAQGCRWKPYRGGGGDGCAPSFRSCALVGCPALFFLQKRRDCPVLQCALRSAIVFFQKSLVPCCFHLLLRSAGRSAALQHPFGWEILCTVNCFYKLHFGTGRVWPVRPSLFLSGNCVIEAEAKIRRHVWRSCMFCFVFFFSQVTLLMGESCGCNSRHSIASGLSGGVCVIRLPGAFRNYLEIPKCRLNLW